MINTTMNSSVIFRNVMFVCLLCFCFAQEASCQDVIGKWKCTNEMFDMWNLGYSYIKGNVQFKNDNTFVVKVKGKKLSKSVYAKEWSLALKVKGTYTIKNDSILLSAPSNAIDCTVDPDMEDPNLSLSDYQLLNIARSNAYDGAGAEYRNQTTQCSFQELAIIEKVLPVWNDNVVFVFHGKKNLQIGEKIILRR